MDETTKATVGGTAGTDNVTEQSNREGLTSGGGAAQDTKTYTAEELQAETDRRVTKAVETANAKAAEAFEKRLADERAKWEKQSKMTAAEREEAAKKEAAEQFEEERRKFNAEKLEYDCTKQLAAQNLPIEFAKMLTGADADETKANIETFKTAFDKAIEAAVMKRMKGKAPNMPSGNPTETDPFLSGFGM